MGVWTQLLWVEQNTNISKISIYGAIDEADGGVISVLDNHVPHNALWLSAACSDNVDVTVNQDSC